MTKLSHRTALVAAVLALALAGCGSSGSGTTGTSAGAGTSTAPGHIHLAKAKFVLHAGLAFGAFHRYIYKPARAGDFSHPFLHKITIVKAGLAGVFVVHELKLALHDAQSDPTLSKLVSPITALESRFSGLESRVRSGQVGQSALAQANTSVSSFESKAKTSGAAVQEQTPGHI